VSPAAHAASAAPYYRCRFPSEYALANRVHHPLNVTLRQDALLEPLDGWLASKFEPCHLGGTINELAAASVAHEIDPGNAELDTKITDCDRKLAQYRATLDAGADPATVARWITETEAERARHKAAKRAATPRPAATSMSRDEIASIVTTLSDVLTVLRNADPADKAEIYTQLGLRLTYQPSGQLVRTEVHIAHAQHWQFESVRGPSRRLPTCPRSLASWALRGSSERVGRRPIRWTTTGCAAGVDRCDSPVPAMHMRI
jgi:site-specific DNA recombinase